jgi:hypothetical protein
VHFALSKRYRQEERFVQSASTRRPRLVLDVGFAPMPDGAEEGYNLGLGSWKAIAIPWIYWNFSLGLTPSMTPSIRSDTLDDALDAVSSNEIVEIETNQDNDGSKEERSLAGAIPMSSELIDLTLPAHDPSFPKPRGLLPVPKEIEEAVAREDERVLREHGIVVAPEARQRMLNDLTLQYYYESAYVASRHTPRGVEVLAVGWDEASKFTRDHPPETRKDIRIGTV